MRQGGDPRLPLELALVKVTRPAADLSREAIAYRLEQLESRGHVSSSHVPLAASGTRPEQPVAEPARPVSEPPTVELEQLQEAWQRTILPAVEEKGGIPTASLLREAHPAQLAGDTLTVEFPRDADFHRQQAEQPKNANLLAETLYEVTGRRLALAFAVGANGETEHEGEPEGPAGEERILELLTETLDARERSPE
jgi:hypothetical protein